MRTWTAQRTVSSTPSTIAKALTEPDAIRTWAPVDFDVEGLRGDRLEAGARARVSGRLAGREVGFDVDVHRADHEGLSLVASGPIDIDVDYRLRKVPEGAEVEAEVSIGGGKGLGGRILAHATGALLAAGALDVAMGRIGDAVAA
jgi:hypothetical protein